MNTITIKIYKKLKTKNKKNVKLLEEQIGYNKS